MKRVLITGINGFIGGHLGERLAKDGWQIRALARDRGHTHAHAGALDVGHDDSVEKWAEALQGIDAVVHLAGIAHRQASAEAYRSINAEWPVRLFEAASQAGVRSFVHMSSIKVLGDVSERPLRPADPYRATGHYALSKVQAEQQLLLKAGASAPLLAIVRAPLVYGPGVKANFKALLKWAALSRRGVPLPLGCATAPRSIVSTHNLSELIAELMQGRSGTFHVCDGKDWSVYEMLQRWGVSPGRLLRIPARFARPAARLAGQLSTFERLFLPLQIDQSATLNSAGWQPHENPGSFLDETLSWYLNNH